MSPFVLVIFGATGDLARNKLIPALFSLFKNKQLPKEFLIIGFSRRQLTDDQFAESFNQSGKDWEKFSSHLLYLQGTFDDNDGYKKLHEKLDSVDDKYSMCFGRFFYLATPPDHYETILFMLEKTKLSHGCGRSNYLCTRVVVEKPFGKDLETAKSLDRKLAEIFKEEQIYRVDHYLGKETVQNMLAFRFANSIFEPVWNNTFIDHVQITFAESRGISGRGKFFDGVGMLRDVAQNHLMQLVATVVMEQPKSFSRESVRDARTDAIAAIKNIGQKDVEVNVISGQYEGYTNEDGVVKGSNTETFVAMKFFVDTPRFAAVPFYVRAGKKMTKDSVAISIVFKQTCHILFKEYGCPEQGNILTIRIQPDEGIGIRVIAKKPSAKLALDTVDMEFSYQDEFGGHGIDAYEKVLLDIFAGDQMLFNRSDELESSWEFITNILHGWQQNKQIPLQYKPGTWGPRKANDLIQQDRRNWI